jgi:hypothetical protein
MVDAITPAQCPSHKAAGMPDGVMIAWNAVIAKNSKGNQSIHVGQEEIIAELMPLTPDGNFRQHIFNENWLDVEPIYEAAGWEVVYDKPAYNETYAASFKFTPKS